MSTISDPLYYENPRVEEYTLGWICALQEEFDCACRMLDDEYEGPETSELNDNNTYVFGSIGGHYLIIGCLPAGVYGTSPATAVAKDMARSFPNLRFALMVGIGGGAPTAARDIRLGDVVVSLPTKTLGGVVQYDMGKWLDADTFERKGQLDSPPQVLLGAIPSLRRLYNDTRKPDKIAQHMKLMEDMQEFQRPENDRLYCADYKHQGGKDCQLCSVDQVVARKERQTRRQITVHYGTIASGNQLIKSSEVRDRFANDPEMEVLCFEMEAAGLMNNFPCLVIRGISDYCDSHKNDDWHNYAALAAAAYARELLLTLKPRNVGVLPGWAEKLTSVQNNISQLKISIDNLTLDSHWNKLKSWLSPPDISTNLNNAASNRYKSTGTWFLDCAPFYQWKNRQKSHIWVYGKPGSGKTVLTSTVIMQLHEEMKASGTVALEFFFDFRDTSKQTVDKMLRSLVIQLYTRSKKSQRELDSLMDTCESGRHQPTTEALSKVLKHMIRAAGEVQIVLDALDECRERPELVKWLQKLIVSDLHNARFLLVSRLEQDLEAGLVNCIPIEDWVPFQNSHVNRDIQAYTRGTLNEDNEFSRWRLKPLLLNQMEVEIMKKANGMFRYAACQLDVFKDCISPQELQKALADMPETLDETYTRILKGIKKQHRSEAMRILQFLTYSDQPLTVDQLVDAIAVDISGSGSFDPEMRLPVPQDILIMCKSLISPVTPSKLKFSIALSIDSRPQSPSGSVSEQRFDPSQEFCEVHLAHFSVKEYLLSERLARSFRPSLGLVEANSAIARVLLSYLTHVMREYHKGSLEDQTSQYVSDARFTYAVKERVTHPVDYDYPLAMFSAQKWISYAKFAEEPIMTNIIKFFFEDKEVFLQWTRLHVQGRVLSQGFQHDEPNALYCAASAGLLQTVEMMIERGADVNLLGGFNSSPLGAACSSGDVRVVRALVARGAHVNLDRRHHTSAGGEDELYDQPIQIAAAKGYHKIIQILLDHGADVNPQGGALGNPLVAACKEGFLEAAEVLLANGANINALDSSSHQCPILASVSAMDDCPDVVKLLLKHGADANHPGRIGRPLTVAASFGHLEAVKVLVESGAEVNPQNEEWLPIETAAYHGFLDIVQFLLAWGADVDERGAIEAACARGDVKTVQQILDSAPMLDFSDSGSSGGGSHASV